MCVCVCMCCCSDALIGVNLTARRPELGTGHRSEVKRLVAVDGVQVFFPDAMNSPTQQFCPPMFWDVSSVVIGRTYNRCSSFWVRRSDDEPKPSWTALRGSGIRPWAEWARLPSHWGGVMYQRTYFATWLPVPHTGARCEVTKKIDKSCFMWMRNHHQGSPTRMTACISMD